MLYLQDVTLRDGLHAVRAIASRPKLAAITRALDPSGIDAAARSCGAQLSESDGPAGRLGHRGARVRPGWNAR